ncbi:Uncharacterized protein dnl_12010 [Desulfonema limicola]|uniref:Uncharacterized protein n=1 Tax=Desulfonema limicola TaxID=45656 RepID=A0A975B569_9BACT|nr:hypothetical protein [Desulfonema limicola]QTA78954.1 Uncharacterized protein dnl_12010 [Desulfonema limicola]
MEDLNLDTDNALDITEELKYMVGNRFQWARNVLNMSRQKLVEHDHFKQIFGCYSIYKIKEIENGFFGKRNVRGELFKFLNGMARFFNVSPKCFIDPVLSRKKFAEIIQKGAKQKYAIFEIPVNEYKILKRTKNIRKRQMKKLLKIPLMQTGVTHLISVYFTADRKNWQI